MIENLRCTGAEENLLDCATGELGSTLSEQCRNPGRSAAVLCTSSKIKNLQCVLINCACMHVRTYLMASNPFL